MEWVGCFLCWGSGWFEKSVYFLKGCRRDASAPRGLLLLWGMVIGLGSATASLPPGNLAILSAVREMPIGGGYAVTREAGMRLQRAVVVRDGRLEIQPGVAQPSYCSGATYLVLLKALSKLGVVLDEDALRTLRPEAQPDGVGVWGRWNANGPGAARLMQALGAGRSFTDYAEAQPGDFMKIFWTNEVGMHERGHLVVFLGLERHGGIEVVRFWSSNKPGGYGEKVVPRSKIARALFTRLENPEGFRRIFQLPPKDGFLASMLRQAVGFEEACRAVGAVTR